MECVKCKKDSGNGKYCRFCGTELGVVPAPEATGDGKAVGKMLAGGCLLIAGLAALVGFIGLILLIRVIQQLSTY